jgi:hypothetical protein
MSTSTVKIIGNRPAKFELSGYKGGTFVQLVKFETVAGDTVTPFDYSTISRVIATVKAEPRNEEALFTFDTDDGTLEWLTLDGESYFLFKAEAEDWQAVRFGILWFDLMAVLADGTRWPWGRGTLDNTLGLTLIPQ